MVLRGDGTAKARLPNMTITTAIDDAETLPRVELVNRWAFATNRNRQEFGSRKKRLRRPSSGGL